MSGNGLNRIEEEEAEEVEEATPCDTSPNSLSVTRRPDASPSQGPKEAALEVLVALASSPVRARAELNRSWP